jgi:ankyrin repeat protein
MKPDATNVHGFTALMWAAGQGRDDVMKLLLDRGANAHAQARDGSEPLIFAAGFGKISTAQMLITAGANANQPSGHTTPLIAAATGNQPEMVVFLLSQRVDINARDSEGCTALFYAANNSKNEDANNATLPLVRILLKEGAKVDIRANDGTTALIWAAGKGEAQVCEALLDAGVDLNAADKEGKSVLTHAVEGGADPALATTLVSRGAKVDAQDAAGETALLKACRRKRAGMAQALLQAGAKPNLQDNQGTTALMIAAAYGNSVLADALQKAGADPNQTNKLGQTAYTIARDKHTAAIDRLKPPQ